MNCGFFINKDSFNISIRRYALGKSMLRLTPSALISKQMLCNGTQPDKLERASVILFFGCYSLKEGFLCDFFESCWFLISVIINKALTWYNR